MFYFISRIYKNTLASITHSYKKSELVLLILLAFASAFILVGGLFFLPLHNATFVQFKVHEILIYLFIVFFLFIDFHHLFIKTDRISFTRITVDREDSQKFYWQSFGIFIAMSLIVWGFFFPGRLSNDSNQVLAQIKTNEFNTHHTVLYTALNKFFWSFIQIFTKNENISIGFLTLIPYITFSMIYSLWATFFYKYGFTKKRLWIVFAIFYVAPNNISQMAYLWKDVFYTQSLLLMMYGLVYLYTQKMTLPYLIGMGALTSFIMMVRFNGLGVGLAVLFLLLIESIRHKNWKIIIAPLITVIIGFYMVHSVIFKALNFKETLTMHKSGLIFQVINTAYLYGHEDSLHPELLKITKADGINQEIWRTATFSYITTMFWTGPNDKLSQKDIDDFKNIAEFLNKDNKTFLKYYLYTWIGSPLIALRTRLNFIQSSWSLWRTHHTLLYPELINMGLTTMFFLLYTFYCFIHKRYLHLTILVPWISNLGIMFFISTATDYRYFWICKWTLLIAILLLFISFDKKSLRNE